MHQRRCELASESSQEGAQVRGQCGLRPGQHHLGAVVIEHFVSRGAAVWVMGA